MFTEIIVRQGEIRLARYLVAPGEYLIGSGKLCHIHIDSSSAEATHLKLNFEDDVVSLENGDSPEGVFLEGRRLSGSSTLQTPSEVQVGQTTLAFNLVAEEAPQTEKPRSNQGGYVSPQDSLSGPHYQTGELINRGAMGGIHLAQDKNIGRQVAMKVILSESSPPREVIL